MTVSTVKSGGLRTRLQKRREAKCYLIAGLAGVVLAGSAGAADWLNIGRIGTRPAQMDVSRVTVGEGFASAPVRLADARVFEGSWTLAVQGCGRRDVMVELRHHAGVNVYRLDPEGERGVDMGGRVLCKIAEGK